MGSGLGAPTATAAAWGGVPLHTAALILALILGAVGLAALFGTFLYAQRQARRRLPAAERRERNRLIAVSLLFWVVAALLVNGAAREGDAVVARLMLVVAGLLFVALVIGVARWLRKPSCRCGFERKREEIATMHAVQASIESHCARAVLARATARRGVL